MGIPQHAADNPASFRQVVFTVQKRLPHSAEASQIPVKRNFLCS